METFIAGLGCEIEGGWKSDRRLDAAIKADGSVRDLGYDFKGGEIVSPVFVSREDLAVWIEKNYPDRTNQTCGLHLHLSFKNSLYYSLLIDNEEFYNEFLEKIEKWGKICVPKATQFWERLAGRNEFCERGFNADAQLMAVGKDRSVRYKHWNFCYNLYKTAECRLMPAFRDAHISVLATNKIVDIVENFLVEKVKKLDLDLKYIEEIEESDEFVVL